MRQLLIGVHLARRCQSMASRSPSPALASAPKKRRLHSPSPAPEPQPAPKAAAKRHRNKKPREPPPESPLSIDIRALLGNKAAQIEARGGWSAPASVFPGAAFEVDVLDVSVTGEGLALLPLPDANDAWLVTIPYALPNERVKITIRHNEYLYSTSRLVEVVSPNADLRDMSRVKCKYFGTCGGCQYQMLSYETQLDLKRNVVVKAYQNFSKLPQELIPPISNTHGSPLQYNYRTKITPHFHIPFSRRKNKEHAPLTKLDIGFNKQGSQEVLDIEECPIATTVLNEALVSIRSEAKKKMNAYKKGATLLMRDSLPNRSLKLGGDLAPVIPSETDSHICVTAHDEVVREHVGTRIFEYLANDFFQNNNSVLGSLVQYVRDGISRPRPGCGEDQLTHLVDTYCGSGFFAISLADRFVDGQIAGIELSASSIEAAKHNARLNGLPEDKVSFRAGTASQIFAAVQDFPASNTVVVIDPPRKGCDEEFIGQLLKFQPRLLVYVSCNVHTQARDVGMIVERSNKYGAKGYVIESVVGFDLFPQTAHVESVAVLYLPM